MLIPETMTFVFILGAVVGSVFTAFTVFLIGLLYRLDCAHLCADEVDFAFEQKSAEA